MSLLVLELQGRRLAELQAAALTVQAWRTEVLRSVQLAGFMKSGRVHATLVTYTQAHSLSHTRRLSLCVQKVQLADSSDSALQPRKAPAAGSGSALGADTITSSKSLLSECFMDVCPIQHLELVFVSLCDV